MSKEMIFDIIDDIAAQAKFIIGAHLQKRELTEALKQSAKDWDETCRDMREVFMDLEDNVRAYFDKHCPDITHDEDNAKEGESEYCIGDKIVFIGNGCAVKDRISRVLVETEMGYQVYIDDAFRSIDELVEHLKKRVHG